MTLPVTGEVYGLLHHHDQQHGLLIVLFWRPNQLGPVSASAWTGQGKWHVIVGQQDDDGAWSWSAEHEAFTGGVPRLDLDRRADGVLEAYLSSSTYRRCRELAADGSGAWS